MSPDPEYFAPEYLPPDRSSSERQSAQPSREDDPAHHLPLQGRDTYVVPAPELPFYTDDRQQMGATGFYAVPGFHDLSLRPKRPRLTPNFGHTVIFFIVALFWIITIQAIAVWTARTFHLLHEANLDRLANDARLNIPSQAIGYLIIFSLSATLFSFLWRRPFLTGIHWNASAVRGRGRWLVLLGIIVGFGVGFGGDFLPMPKDAPIVQDMMNTTTGAWLMFLFSFTGAPLMEELAFRGFLMPSLANSFRWMSDRGWLPTSAVKYVGVPISILLTSLAFALLHGPQVSHSWGPVLLIGIVSVVLCVVRLTFDSVFASAVVHSAYNFTLFTGILVTTDAFRHLEKLKN